MGVKGGVVNSRVVDSVLLSTGDTDLHLQPQVDLGHTLEVGHASGDVVLL